MMWLALNGTLILRKTKQNKDDLAKMAPTEQFHNLCSLTVGFQAQPSAV